MRKWTFQDDIHFVRLQLNHYYGINNWPRRYCSTVVGISDTTCKKYESDPWGLTLEEKEYITNLLDYSNRQIKKLTYDENVYYAGSKDIITKPFIEYKSIIKEVHIETKILEEDFTSKRYLKPFVNYVETDNSGLYMLAEIVSEPTKPANQHYLIKVGMSTNLQERTSAYKGMNPFAVVIDVTECSRHNLKSLENEWHKKLSIIGERQNGTEWFAVPKEEYKKFLQLGFDYN